MVVCACVVSSSLDEAGVSFSVMRAPWSLGGERRGTGPVAQLLLPLSYATVGWGRGAVFRDGCRSVVVALADGGRLSDGCDGLGGREFVLLGAPEGCDFLLLCELMLDERVEEFVVEGLVPGLAREHLSEVRASLTHNLLEADHGGALGGHRHVFGRFRESDDVRPVVGEHRLVPRDAQLQFRVVLRYPVQHLHHPRPIVGVRDGGEKLVERLDCHIGILMEAMYKCGKNDPYGSRNELPCQLCCKGVFCHQNVCESHRSVLKERSCGTEGNSIWKR